jgi:hypothetical protein
MFEINHQLAEERSISSYLRKQNQNIETRLTSTIQEKNRL